MYLESPPKYVWHYRKSAFSIAMYVELTLKLKRCLLVKAIYEHTEQWWLTIGHHLLHFAPMEGIPMPCYRGFQYSLKRLEE